MRTRVWLPGAAWSFACATQLWAQAPLTYEQLRALEAPPPTHRISYGASPLQFANLRLPKGAGPHQVVVFIHGGCYLSQYPIGHVAALEQAFADSGYAVWSIEYRRQGDPGGGWPETFRDVGVAADHLRTLAESHRLDLSRIVAAGHSVGANFALWLSVRDRIRNDSPLYVERPLKIHGVLGLAPAPDLAALHAQGVCGRVMDSVMGGSPEQFPERYRDVSPAMLLPIPVPQILLVGALDRSWGPRGRAYHALAVAAGDSLARLEEAPAAGHFDLVAPPTTTWPFVMDALRALFRRITGEGRR